MTRLAAWLSCFVRGGHDRVIVMHRAVEAVVRLVPAPDVFDVSAVGIRPAVILSPGRREVSPRHFDDRDESLCVQVINLPVHELEIVRVDAVHVRENQFVTGDFSGKQKCPAAFVRHVFRVPSVSRFVAGDLALVHPRRPHAEVRLLVQPDFPRLAVVRPVRKGGDDGDGVEALAFAQPQVILEPRIRADGPWLIVVVPLEAMRRRRIPGVAEQEKWRAVGIFKRMTIGGGADEPAARGHGFFFRLRPFNGLETAALVVQAGVLLVRPAAPVPLTRRGGEDTDAEHVTTVPETVTAFVESGSFQIHPDLDVGVGIGVGILGVKGQFNFFPDMHVAGRCHGRLQGNGSHQWHQKFHARHSLISGPTRQSKLQEAES